MAEAPTEAIPEPAPSLAEAAAIDPTAIDPATVSADEFAAFIRAASDEQIAAGLAAARGQILDEIFRRMAEHFDPANAAGVNAVIDWKITGRGDGGFDHYQVAIRNDACEVREEPTEEPRATLELPAASFVRLATGNLLGAGLFFSGELQIEGDVSFAMTVERFFRIPQPSAPAPQSASPGPAAA